LEISKEVLYKIRVTFKYDIFIVPKLIKFLFNMFAFWVLDAEMATGWEIGIEKKSKKYPIGCRIIEKSFRHKEFASTSVW
jgi:hypothetical protein